VGGLNSAYSVSSTAGSHQRHKVKLPKNQLKVVTETEM
jgi:hypothetical protein